MPDEAIFDESRPFVAPSPTITASDLLRIVEEIQERKRLLDIQLMAVLPNLVASYVLSSCESAARREGRSLSFRLSPPTLVEQLPHEARKVLNKDNDLLNSCHRIRPRLGSVVQGILMHLDFICQVTDIDNVLKIEISW